MPTAHTIAAARTAYHTLTSLREVTGRTAEVKVLNDAIDKAIEEAIEEATRLLPDIGTKSTR